MREYDDFGRVLLAIAASCGLILTIAFASGCGGLCMQAAHKADKICVAEREFTQCGPKAVGIIDQILPLIIAQDWSQALTIVATQAPDEYECIADVLDDKISKATYGPAHATLQSYRSARRLKALNSNGRFKVIDTDGKVAP